MSGFPCQAGGINPVTTDLPCPATDSGGIQCERRDMPHLEHFVGAHTQMHILAGNGYSCESIERGREGCRT